jgi:hypothetical protein
LNTMTNPSFFHAFPMRSALLMLFCCIGLHLFASPNAFQDSRAPVAPGVNAVLGDLSWELAFGCTPTDAAPEVLRIQTHLAFVEALLRSVDTRHWPDALREKRAQQLDRLRDYREAGVFPRNTEFAGRRPIFIDAEGRLCAVGYLIAQDAGLDLARAVDAEYHAGYVLDMDAEAVQAWIAQSGLTAEECAMIQPAYAPPTPATTLSDGYLYATGGWTLANGFLIGINGKGYLDGEGSLVWSILGLASGAGQIAYGAWKAPVLESDCVPIGWGAPCTVDNEAPAAWTNIGAGSLASIAAILRLTRGRAKASGSSTGWNAIPDAVTVPNPAGDGIALRWQYRF